MRYLYAFILSLFMGGQVFAGEIKAIVNDYPISAFDVETRAKMIMLQQAGQVGKLTEDLKQIALEDLIREQIQFQEMKKQGIEVSAEEVDDALTHLEAQNKMQKGEFKKVLEKQGISYQTLVNQTKANLGWLRVLQKAGKTISVDEKEVSARREVIRRELNKSVVSVAEIMLKTEEEAIGIWRRLQEGADFSTLVELYSIADSRLHGGRVMNVEYAHYGHDVSEILYQMQVGQLSRPIPTEKGYVIILMLNKREAVTGDTVRLWELAQAIVPKNSVADALLRQPVNGGCDMFSEIVKDDVLAGSFQRGNMNPAQLPSDIAPMLNTAEFQKVIGPLEMPEGFLYFMKCSENEQRVMPDDDVLKSQIEAEKMELISKQLLSELKRDVIVEYK